MDPVLRWPASACTCVAGFCRRGDRPSVAACGWVLWTGTWREHTCRGGSRGRCGAGRHYDVAYFGGYSAARCVLHGVYNRCDHDGQSSASCVQPRGHVQRAATVQTWSAAPVDESVLRGALTWRKGGVPSTVGHTSLARTGSRAGDAAVRDRGRPPKQKRSTRFKSLPGQVTRTHSGRVYQRVVPVRDDGARNGKQKPSWQDTQVPCSTHQYGDTQFNTRQPRHPTEKTNQTPAPTCAPHLQL